VVESSKAMTVSPAAEVFGEAKKNWGWLLALGILFVILGTIGLGMSMALTLASMLFFGWLLIIGGIFQVVEAFKQKGWKSVLWHVLIALVYIGAGAIILYDPVGGALTLTVFIAAALIAVGAMRLIMALQLRGARGWWWPLVGGLLSILLGVMIMAEWPSSAFWVIGLLIAIEMIVNGWSYVMVALTARQVVKAEEKAGATAATA
jgi:uncharacterized membrane protein HdeD (DUF308 family)